MHEHDRDPGAELRPRGDRLDDDRLNDDRTHEDAGALGAAIDARRADVIGPTGFLALQRAAGNAGVGDLVDAERSPVLDVVNSGGGQPLDVDTRTDMEARLGHDFGDVHVHTSDAAHESARGVGAHAYTVGSNVVFQRDRYDPGSDDGKLMLAHELTHVVQQRQGPVDGSDAGGGIRVSDPADRFEQEASATAERVMSAPDPAPVTPAHGDPSAVQRTAVDPNQPAQVQRAPEPAEDEDREEEEGEPVQTFPVQRQEEEEEVE